jgi:hypothetical protein
MNADDLKNAQFVHLSVLGPHFFDSESLVLLLKGDRRNH